MKKIILTSLVLFSLFVLSGCKEATNNDENIVYVTVYPMEFLVEALAGDSVIVKRIPGSTSHGDYVEWSAKEIIDMKHSDLLIYINGGVDNFVPNNAETFEDGDVELVDMSEHIEYNMVCYTHSHDEETHTEEEHSDTCDSTQMNPDPHFWLDPVRMQKAAEYLKDKLISTYPENSDVIENNFTSLNASLIQLNTEFEAMAEKATKPIITTVMLFTYWHERYDLEILSITTDAHSSELVPGDIIDFVNHAKEDNITYILFEKNANSPAGEKLLELLLPDVPETSRLYLHGIGNITPDEYESGETYLTLMYENLETLTKATK
jgi:zinc transport system substrate-binding protein